MQELPKVMAGGPIRMRPWAAGEWLIGLLNQDYPAQCLRIVVLVNDSPDETKAICEWVGQRYGWMVASFEVKEVNFGCAVDNNDRFQRRDYHQFARVRNAWLDLRQDEEYVWFDDSDIICPPHILSGLVANGLDLCSAVIENNVYSSTFHTNVMEWLDASAGPDEGFFWPPEAIDTYDLMECDLTGACFLISRRVLDAGIRYQYHLWGEDAPFCWEAQQKGFRLFADGRLRADHRMKPPAYTGRENPTFCSMMAELWEFHHARSARADVVRTRRKPHGYSYPHPARLPGESVRAATM